MKHSLPAVDVGPTIDRLRAIADQSTNALLTEGPVQPDHQLLDLAPRRSTTGGYTTKRMQPGAPTTPSASRTARENREGNSRRRIAPPATPNRRKQKAMCPP